MPVSNGIMAQANRDLSKQMMFQRYEINAKSEAGGYENNICIDSELMCAVL